jgi:hypothetical protein
VCVSWWVCLPVDALHDSRLWTAAGVSISQGHGRSCVMYCCSVHLTMWAAGGGGSGKSGGLTSRSGEEVGLYGSCLCAPGHAVACGLAVIAVRFVSLVRQHCAVVCDSPVIGVCIVSLSPLWLAFQGACCMNEWCLQAGCSAVDSCTTLHVVCHCAFLCLVRVCCLKHWKVSAHVYMAAVTCTVQQLLQMPTAQFDCALSNHVHAVWQVQHHPQA